MNKDHLIVAKVKVIEIRQVDFYYYKELFDYFQRKYFKIPIVEVERILYPK